jgi:hypothetical protein
MDRGFFVEIKLSSSYVFLEDESVIVVSMKHVQKIKMTDKSIREVFEKVKNDIKPVTGKYRFTTKNKVVEFIRENSGKPMKSSVIGGYFEVNKITEDHLFCKNRIEKGIIYYEIIGVDSTIPNTIIHVKLSEVHKNGKAYFTVFAISGGAPVPATSSKRS